ncbi:MAG: glycosyltransferase [Parafilimonas sp.]|nr:glycosyltransferase [Parafilimonas sp.]
MEQTKTLVILSPGFAKDEEDTTCLPPQQVFIKSLNENFPSLKIIILAFDYPFFEKKYKWFSNTIISFNGFKRKKIARLFLWLRIYRTLKKINKQNNVIGLLSFWCGQCAFIGKIFSKRNHLKHLIWILGQDAKRNNLYVRWIKPKPDELIAMSDFLSETFFKSHKIKPTHIIPNGVDTKSFPATGAIKKVDIMGAGSLISLKQYNTFIEVVFEIKKLLPNINVVLCGKGPEEKKLEELIRQYNLEKNIVLAGEKRHNEVLQLMQQSKIFLHTSLYEGFSTVCLEALYAGAHVISFIKPMQHSIDHWQIVTSKDEMIQKTLHLLNNPLTAYTSVLAYSMDDSAKEMMKLF